MTGKKLPGTGYSRFSRVVGWLVCAVLLAACSSARDAPATVSVPTESGTPTAVVPASAITPTLVTPTPNVAPTAVPSPEAMARPTISPTEQPDQLFLPLPTPTPIMTVQELAEDVKARAPDILLEILADYSMAEPCATSTMGYCEFLFLYRLADGG